MGIILFYVLAAVALGGALVVVGQRNPTYSAFALIATMAALSGIFGLLGSPFIAALQVVVYAGAIMVLFLFVIMLLNVGRELHPPGGSRAFKGAALFLLVLLGSAVSGVILGASLSPPPASFDASTKTMAGALFAPVYLYAFEATSVLILAALVGAVVLAKKDL